MKYIITLFVFFYFSVSTAQTNCFENLQAADKAYRDGRFDEGLTLLESCLEKGFTRDEKILAYRLVSLCNFRLNKLDKAEYYAKIFLKMNPLYLSFPMDDPKDFSKFLNNFQINLRWQGGIRAGAALTDPVILKQFTSTEQTNTYRSSLQYCAGMQISFHILPNLILRTEPGYSRLQYKRSVDDVLGVKLNYSETQNYFDLPLRLLIGKQFSNSWIYAGIGTSAFFMGNAYGLLLSEDISTGNKILNSFDVKDSRKPVSLTADFGAGFEMKAGSGRLGFSVFRSQSFGNLMQETKRYEDMFMVLSTKYIENDFKLNSMRMQLYYQIPLSYRVIKK